jgi:hypothetical protein
MWTLLLDQSFLLGAALVTLVHATKFGELNLGNPVTGRYLALLPGAKVRDFVGPYAYHISLLAFLCVSLVSYYLCCHISPNVLNGATKVFGNVDAEKTFQDVPPHRGGPGCLNRISASISGASAGVRLPSGGAAA